MLPDRFTDAPVPSSDWRYIFRQRHENDRLYASGVSGKIEINKDEEPASLLAPSPAVDAASPTRTGGAL